jgi:hypothetical protein
MKILQTALPSKIAISSQADIEEFKNHVLNGGFAVIDEYKDMSYKSNCAITYDFKILLATIKNY